MRTVGRGAKRENAEIYEKTSVKILMNRRFTSPIFMTLTDRIIV